MLKTKILFAVLFLFASCGTPAIKTSIPNNTKDSVKREEVILQFPKAEQYVNDFDSILTPAQQKELNEICANYDKQTTNQLVVATVKDIKPYNDIKDYAKDLFNEWKIGTKEKNNGVLIVLCVKCNEVRITVGYGAEKSLTAEITDAIVDPGMVGYFQKNKNYEGLKFGIKEIIKKWKE
jgi:uncharacterized protein